MQGLHGAPRWGTWDCDCGYRGAALRDGGAGAVGSTGLGGEAVHQVEELRLWAALAFCC